jgi:predicted SnoaL-like aldol condensation-catalyzing enzyme
VKSFVECRAAKVDVAGHRLLALDLQSSPLQTSGKHRFIDRFEQARPETRVELVRRIDNFTGNLVDLSRHFPLSPPRLRVSACAGIDTQRVPDGHIPYHASDLAALSRRFGNAR